MIVHIRVAVCVLLLFVVFGVFDHVKEFDNIELAF